MTHRLVLQRFAFWSAVSISPFVAECLKVKLRPRWRERTKWCTEISHPKAGGFQFGAVLIVFILILGVCILFLDGRCSHPDRPTHTRSPAVAAFGEERERTNLARCWAPKNPVLAESETESKGRFRKKSFFLINNKLRPTAANSICSEVINRSKAS